MQQLFLFAIICVSYLLIGIFANPVKELSVSQKTISSLLSYPLKKKGQVKTNAVSGTFPTNPTYAVGKSFSDSDCNTLTGGASILLNTCLTNGTQSERYVCTGDGGLTESIYSDTACNTLIANTTRGTECTKKDELSYEQLTGCGTSVFNYDTSKSWVVYATYQTSECTNILETGAVPNGECFPFNDTGSVFSLLYSWPNVIGYSNSDCTGTKFGTAPISQVCTVDDDQIDYDNTVYVAASSSSNDDSLSGGAIAGIIIAVIVVLLLIGALLYYFLCFKKSAPAIAQQQKTVTPV